MRARAARLLRHEDGYSLSEMLVVLVIVGILMSAFASIVQAMVTHSTGGHGRERRPDPGESRDRRAGPGPPPGVRR